MTKTALALVSAMIVSVLAPDEALADRRHGFRGDRHRLHSELPKRVFPHHRHHRHFHRHNGGFAVIGPSVIVVPSYVPPPVYEPAPVYVPPAYSYAPPPPMQRVVEFPTGRYELHGDGVTTAYRWVWIPNPPTSPPIEEPSVAPPPPASEAPAPAERTRRADIYRWTDDAGVVHITDRLEKVPDAYRSKVTKTQS